jgi:AcrR family transcriptional regulator
MPRADREQLILEVAGQVFARSDYHAASMDEIAELAGVSKPMLYAYFDSKEGLYIAYIKRTGGELVERLVQAAAPDASPSCAAKSPRRSGG